MNRSCSLSFTNTIREQHDLIFGHLGFIQLLSQDGFNPKP